MPYVRVQLLMSLVLAAKASDTCALTAHGYRGIIEAFFIWPQLEALTDGAVSPPDLPMRKLRPQQSRENQATKSASDVLLKTCPATSPSSASPKFDIIASSSSVSRYSPMRLWAIELLNL